jgi:hypothetical protein
MWRVCGALAIESCGALYRLSGKSLFRCVGNFPELKNIFCVLAFVGACGYAGEADWFGLVREYSGEKLR